ncbi:large ribosomal subunit protein mL45 isoform X1 [Microcaecilia unicolor]|uniref:Large ribosomal subunit protein mL45 n=1 Tax=Microcaecilia unicolor TaxID=1415580 RepID=A0A6P7ZPT7_9AMPH|nr:39S ribosomal protein L45, mitochondrial isoform X1 [Microcaecilia unicolor]
MLNRRLSPNQTKLLGHDPIPARLREPEHGTQQHLLPCSALLLKFLHALAQGGLIGFFLAHSQLCPGVHCTSQDGGVVFAAFSFFHAAGIFDAYIPPEGDARLTSLSKDGLKQRTEHFKQNVASQLAIRKVKDYDGDFSVKTFPEKAQEIFIEAHNYLTNFDRHKLHTLVTERCYPEMVRGNRYKSLRWSFVESLESPRVVQVRCPEMVNKGNLYGQVTVRMHTRQTLAIYDRFGRLMYGQEDMPKDVLEYVVFERHLVNPYGSWRMHGKIVPVWAPSKDPIVKTLVIPGPKLQPEQEFEMNSTVSQPKNTQWYK